MQERINKRRFALLAMLTLLTALALWWVQPENRVAVDEGVFRVEDLGSVSRIELASGSSTVRLAFDGGRWRVNDRYDADGSMIRVLFATLQQARPKRDISGARADSIFSELGRSGVRVSLFSGEELQRRFLAGGNSSKTQAFFADPDTQEVYVMTIPGYRVYVSGILELPENGWRDKFVFGFNWRNFKSLKADFPGSRAEGFSVSRGKDHFGIDGIAETDTAKLNTFLDDISLLTVDGFLPEPKLSDSLRALQPHADFSVEDIAGRTYRLRLYEQPAARRALAVIQDSQVAVLDRRKIQPLLKPRSFFRKK